MMIHEAIKMYNYQCQDCGETDWTLLNFHHTQGRSIRSKNDSLTEISKRIYNAGEPLNEYQLLCCNCHRRADIRDGTNNAGIKLKQLQEKFCPNS